MALKKKPEDRKIQRNIALSPDVLARYDKMAAESGLSFSYLSEIALVGGEKAIAKAVARLIKEKQCLIFEEVELKKAS